MSKYLFIIFLLSIFAVYGCSRKHIPEQPVQPLGNTTNNTATKNDSLANKKIKPKEIVPKVIVVNDKAAHESIDGRLYYDLLGHRYWKNYKDGKYYLFNKSMYSNPAFKAPKK